MLWVRFQYQGSVQTGIWQEGQIYTPQGALGVEAVQLLPPVQPTKIIAVGKNYRDHAAEMGGSVPEAPLLFLKAPSALIGSGEKINLPAVSKRVDYEGELAVILGQTARRVSPEEAPHYISGYSCANDVTARDLQKSDHQWSRAKGFDSFCPLGPFLYQGALPPDTQLTTKLNGRVVQSAQIQEMVFSPTFLVSYISQIMTLYPGDVILTGTPAGVGPLTVGDVVEVTIAGIGTLCNSVSGSVT